MIPATHVVSIALETSNVNACQDMAIDLQAIRKKLDAFANRVPPTIAREEELAQS